MKFAIYTRVSTEDQTTENQVLRLVEYAKRNGYEYEIFREVMSSRKTRPVKAEVLRALRAKEYDGVLMTKIDRWARSLQELIMEFRELEEKGLLVISVLDNIDLTTSAGKLQFQILGAFAEFERNIIRERTMEGLARAKAEGKTLGRPKGSKDIKQRKRSGYHLRWEGKGISKERNTYFCPRCEKRHSKKSKLGIKHQKYKQITPPSQ